MKCFHFYLTPKVAITPVEMLSGLGQQWDLSMNGRPEAAVLEARSAGTPPNTHTYSNSGASRVTLLAAAGVRLLPGSDWLNLGWEFPVGS